MRAQSSLDFTVRGKKQGSESIVYRCSPFLGSFLDLITDIPENNAPSIYPAAVRAGMLPRTAQITEHKINYTRDTGKANFDENPKYFQSNFQWSSLWSLSRLEMKANTRWQGKWLKVTTMKWIKATQNEGQRKTLSFIRKIMKYLQLPFSWNYSL